MRPRASLGEPGHRDAERGGQLAPGSEHGIDLGPDRSMSPARPVAIGAAGALAVGDAALSS